MPSNPPFGTVLQVFKIFTTPFLNESISSGPYKRWWKLRQVVGCCLSQVFKLAKSINSHHLPSLNKGNGSFHQSFCVGRSTFVHSKDRIRDSQLPDFRLKFQLRAILSSGKSADDYFLYRSRGHFWGITLDNL